MHSPKVRKYWPAFAFILVVDFLYPMTFTYDSGHFLSYLPILEGNVSFGNWDPVRGPIFPIFLLTIKIILGKSLNSLLLPYVFFHQLVLLISTALIFDVNETFGRKLNEGLLFGLIFIIIGLDPLIIGYFHLVLTEGLATLLAFLTIVICYKVYQKAIARSKIYTGFYCILSVLMIIAYHLKQPYVSSVLYPVMITIIFLSLYHKEYKISVLKGILIIFVPFLISIYLWSLITVNTREDRKISTYIEKALTQNIKMLRESPKDYVVVLFKNYLALSNVFYFDQAHNYIEPNFSLLRAAENEYNGYRIYNYGWSNLSVPIDYPYIDNVRNYYALYYPPFYLNLAMIKLKTKSNLFFSTLYLVAPLLFLFLSLIGLKLKSQKKSYPEIEKWWFLSLLFVSTAFMNAIQHVFMLNPIDRYNFIGYPLLLVGFILICLGIIGKTNLKSLRE